MASASLPADFLEKLPEIFGPRIARQVERTFVERPLSIRINTLKAEVSEVLNAFSQSGIVFRRVPWSSVAFLLPRCSKRHIEKHELYKTGCIYLQSLASQVPPIVLDPKPGERILDLTAAPGSKTSQIAALMRGKGQLVAVEKNRIRFDRMEYNLRLLGVCGSGTEFCLTRCADAARSGFLDEHIGSFDRVLLDAPCSGEARFTSRNRQTYQHWRIDRVKQFAKEQAALLDVAWKALKPGGTLVYATCTFSPDENEWQIDNLLRRYGSDAVLEDWNLNGLNCLACQSKRFSRASGKRIIPTNEIEGFFMAKIKKRQA